MSNSQNLTLNVWVPGQHLKAAARAWLRRTNAALADCTGVQVTNLFLVRLMAGSALTAAALYGLLWLSSTAAWVMAAGIAGGCVLWQCMKEYVRKGGAS